VESAEDPNLRQEIQLSLRSIVESSDKWLGRLKRRQSRVRFASAFLTTILVFAGVGIAVLVFLFSQGQLSAYLQHPNQSYSLISASGLTGLISGFATYFLLRRKHNTELKDLTSLIIEMKNKIEGKQEGKKPDGAGGEAITADALSLADKIMTLLPELVRKRSQDSLLFGVVAFILAGIFGNNIAVAILVGVIVWLYFRYETRKTYEAEISKFEEQKRVFEQRKKDFMESL
jgi:hypothetical protein